MANIEAVNDLKITEDHWLDPVNRTVSPNQDERPMGYDISLLVIHAISLPPGEFGTGEIERLFTNSLDCGAHPSYSSLDGVHVSSHALIDREGKVTQFVPFDRRAWHAGQSSFQGQKECNNFGIGIELEGTEEVPFTEKQYSVLIAIARVLMDRYPCIQPHRIVGHNEIAPDRKWDPGPQFDWPMFEDRLRELSLLQKT
ncbi:MAG: 1,6-anhydro-N-acetylmuramyl-L-alanine amidase AmpD [Gammaproteobacteria bacterium]|nr:1,6-anhydro-N-acetylmuramyl-L-alanine amidase AmpD [Gammaproteobacteria bacterium]